MPNYTVTNNIDALLKSTSNADARTNLGLGDAATKNTGTTAGTVAAGDDSRITGALQTSGGTMTGKLTLPAATSAAAPLNIGSSGVQPTTPATGDVWIRNNALQYKGSSSTVNTAAATAEPNQFSARQVISVTDNSNPALRVTQLGTGEALRVEDEANPDATAFVVSASGRVGVGVTPDASVALAVDSTGIKFSDNSVQTTAGLTGTVGIANGGTGQTTANAAINALLPSQTGNIGKILSTDGTNTSWATAFKFSNTKVVGVDAATIQGCIDLVSSPTALTQVQVLIPPGVYNENLTLKPCVSLASTGLNNGQSSIVRIVGTHTLTGGTSAGDNIIQLNGLRMDYQASTSPTLTISATGTTPLLVHMQDCMIGNSNASTSSVGVLVNQYCSLKCNNVKSLANPTSGSGGTHIEVNAGTFYGDQFSTEYGTLALRLSGTGGAFKPYVELKQCSLSCTGSNVVDITSTTALFSAGWTSFANTATTGNGINIAASSVIGVFNSVFVITAGASNYVVTGAVGGVYYSLNNSYSNATGVPYETKVNANISQFLYSSSIPSALTALTGDVTASGTGSQAATVARIQGRNVLSTAPTNGQVLAWNGTAWAPAAAAAAGVSSFSAGTTGLSPSTASTGAVTLAGTLAIANGGTGQTTQQAAINALAGATTSGQYLRGNGTNVTLSAIQAADVPTLNQNTTGTASNVTGTVAVANGGTGATTLTGLVKGNGTSAFIAATAGTDYVVPSGSITGTAGNVTGTVAIANGGTGQTTAANAINALVPAQSGQSGKVLTTNGSVVSWGTAGGGGITALTGDVSASGSGSVSASVTGLRGRVVATTAPTAGQVLGWNATTNEWEPTSAGGAVSYDVLRVFITGPATGIYTIPSGYKLADIYACSGGGGGGSGSYSNPTGFVSLSGGGGGAHGIFGLRKSINVNGGMIQYDIGAGGSGGVPDPSGSGSVGQPGAGTLISYYTLPSGVGSSSIILDCGYYINNASLSNTGGQAGGYGNANGGSVYYPNTWIQNTQNGGNAQSSSPGLPPNANQSFVETTYVSSGGGGGGLTSGVAVYGGGNILDQNYVLYSSGVAIPFNGTTTSSSTIDATPVQFYPNLNIFWGGAGGAAADSSIAYYNGSTYRAGRGADGQYGCGGGGGGSMYDDLGAGSGMYSPGSGGNGGAGFLLMYLYK